MPRRFTSSGWRRHPRSNSNAIRRQTAQTVGISPSDVAVTVRSTPEGDELEVSTPHRALTVRQEDAFGDSLIPLDRDLADEGWRLTIAGPYDGNMLYRWVRPHAKAGTRGVRGHVRQRRDANGALYMELQP